MKRRDFLKGMAAISALAVLPVLAKTNDEVIGELIEKDFIENVDKAWKSLDFPTANKNRILDIDEVPSYESFLKMRNEQFGRQSYK